MANIKCKQIGVDCVRNDPVDINKGGPEYLGFDFFVRNEENSELKKFIAITLNNLEIPYISIYSNDAIVLTESELWTKEKIKNTIKKDANYLRQQAKREYKQKKKIRK